jgi:hypothetical protein
VSRSSSTQTKVCYSRARNMSCYVRHLTDFFEALKVENNRDNRKAMDKSIRKILRVDEPCPQVWKKLKTILADSKKKEGLVKKLKMELAEA